MLQCNLAKLLLIGILWELNVEIIENLLELAGRLHAYSLLFTAFGFGGVAGAHCEDARRNAQQPHHAMKAVMAWKKSRAESGKTTVETTVTPGREQVGIFFHHGQVCCALLSLCTATSGCGALGSGKEENDNTPGSGQHVLTYTMFHAHGNGNHDGNGTLSLTTLLLLYTPATPLSCKCCCCRRRVLTRPTPVMHAIKAVEGGAEPAHPTTAMTTSIEPLRL